MHIDQLPNGIKCELIPWILSKLDSRKKLGTVDVYENCFASSHFQVT
jgi:hypothetical protein